MEKFSFSKLSTFDQCPYKYDLMYRQHRFINEKNIAQDFGTLVHYIEECIAKKSVELADEFTFFFDVNPFIDMFINIDDEKNHIYGMKKLKQLYTDSFYEKDKNGFDYEDKGNLYLNKGIYRLYNFLSKNTNLKIVGIEQEFNLAYKSCVFHGFIDRVFQDKVTKNIYIEDIKTYSSPIDKQELTTPLQFVFYSLAAKDLYNVDLDSICCAYELPLCDIKQQAGTSGFITRGCKKIDKLLNNIDSGMMEPKPSPLCHWCVYSETFKNQPEEAKNLCPYYCKWTREMKDFSVYNEWMGTANHDKILEDFKRRKPVSYISAKNTSTIPKIDMLTERRFLLRR